MKRLLVFALSFIMAVTFGFNWTGQASAVEKEGKDIKRSVQTTSKEYKEHQALVMFKTDDSMSSKNAKSTLKSGDGGIDDIKIADTWSFKKAPEGNNEKKGGEKHYANVSLVESGSLTTEQLVEQLKQRDDVLYAEPNYEIHALDVDDPYYGKQWSMASTDVEYEWDDNGVTGTDAIVAVVDTGVDYTHEELSGNMWENTHYPKLRGECGFDFRKADDDPMDENGHGTHCAGIIGAKGNNGVGISGVNRDVKIMACRILDEYGSGYNAEEVAAYNYINKALDLGEPIKAINNSWGGGDDSDIFAELIDIVGEKGAISVFAAGNDGINNDEDGYYPANIDSEYSIVVAATKKEGGLVSFSNYGKNTVDVAAPGTDILSTVNYDCYNPGIYGDKNNEISKHFNNYEGDEGWGVPADEDVTLPEGATYSASVEENIGFNGNGLRMSFNNMKSDSFAFVSVPYTLAASQVEEEPYASIMVRPEVNVGDDSESFFAIADVPASEEITEGIYDEYDLSGYYLSTDQDYWDHYELPCLTNEDDRDNVETERQIVMMLYAEKKGNYDIIIDDFGVSEENIDPSQFGKYDYMSGTSMAAPFVSGAVALKTEELKQASGKDPEPTEVVSEILALADDDGLDVGTGGELNFSKRAAELGPRIASVEVDTEKNNIILSGSGLKESIVQSIEVSYAGRDEYSQTNIVAGSGNEKGTKIAIQDNGWINNLVDIKVTGYADKIATKTNVYLVKGKTKYDEIEGVEDLSEGGKVVTDGKRIYTTSSPSNTVLALNPDAVDEGYKEVAELDPEDLFDTSENSETAEYAMLFSRDMACLNGKLYTVVEYGEMVEKLEEDDDFWIIFSKTGKAIKSIDEDEDDDEEYAANGVLYSSELQLVEINPSNGNYESLGELPEDLEGTMDWSLTTYNGKLYFIGGYTMAPASSKGLSKMVKTYDPATDDWDDGPQLPEGRAFGHAIQTGSNLVYTLGYGEGQRGVDEEEQECPKNLVFDGNSWKTSGETLVPFDAGDVVRRGSDDYVVFDGNIGICKDGIVYIGTPVEDYGDTFTFNVGDGKFTDTGYNYSIYTDNEGINGTTVGDMIYALEDEAAYTAPIDSGFIYIKCGKVKNGKVTGANRYYNPGDKASITAKAKSKYKIKSFKVGSTKVKLKKKATKKTYVTKPLTKNLTVKVTFKKK